jgi:HAMP domain-containing protein
MENKTAVTACAASFAVGIVVGFSLNRWLRRVFRKLEKDL